MTSNALEDQDKGNNIIKRVNKILESRLENDKDTLTALKELSTFFTENNIQSRRNLRSKIEKRSLDINEDFLSAFRKVKESLDSIYSDVLDMNTAVQNMGSQLNATKAQTHHLLEQTAKLQAENQKICMQEEITDAFLRSFQLSKTELMALREANITEDFFGALERVLSIHSSCRNLMQCGHQTSALDIMDQMAMYQEAALERLYRWAQTHCKSIESPGISQLLTKAMSKLQDRPVLFKYVVNEYCTHRRSVLVRIFLDALTKGGPSGTPKPIEMHAHDPQRYIADMLAFLHQAIPSENENLLTFLKGCDKIDVTEQVQEALTNISEGVCTPLRVRVEHIILSDISVKALYSVTNLLWFYHQTFTQEIGEFGGLVKGLKELYEQSGETLINQLTSLVKKEVESVSIPPSDLSPSPGVETLLSLLRDLLSVAPVTDSRHQYPSKIVGCVLEPLLQAVNISASRLATTDMAVYLLNCLHLMQTTLAFYEFMDERLERLQAQCDAQLDTLTSEQASSLVANLNLGPIYTILQEQGKGPLSHIPGMQPSSLNNFLEIGEFGGLVKGLKELYEQSGETLINQLTSLVKKEVESVSIPPSDLSPSPGVETLLSLLRDLLSVAPVTDSRHQYPSKIVGCVLEPLLQAVNISASRLATTDMAVYLLNCLHLMQTTLAFYEFMDERLERLQAQCDAQLDTLTSEQASSLVANLNLGPIYTILQEQGKGPLSHIPGMQPSSLNNFLRKLENFISMPELLQLPQVNCLLSGNHRTLVQKRSIEVIVAIYKQLYQCIHDPTNLYENPSSFISRTPQQVSDALLGVQPE